MLGVKGSQKRLQPYLADTANKVLLDVGAGTGLQRSLVFGAAQYLWLDNDLKKLQGFIKRHAIAQDIALIGDGSTIGLCDQSVDWSLCIAVSHHLTDQQLSCLFKEIARVTREKMVFLDAVVYPSPISRLLWQYDRGSLPRSTAALLAAIEVEFEIEQVEQYKIYHHYLLCTAHPKKHQPENKS
jgi:SAM-dependent methyltransferase